jgi:MoxR-like ATPase
VNYQLLANLENWLGQQIVGQQDLIHKLMLALLADGHLLVEGAPGLAKTRAIKEMAEGIEGSFHRIQFTPDLLPGDITGTDIFRPQTGAFEFQQGPFSTTWCWQTRSTAPLPKCSPRSWRPWPNAR